MIRITVSSWSCFCWLHRTFPLLAANNIVNLISVLTIWWCPCVESSLVLLEEGLCYTSPFSWQNSISLCPPSFYTPGPNLPVTPGISWLPTFAFQSPVMKITSFFGVSFRLWRRLSAEELILLNCGVGEDSWESLGLQGDPTSPFWRRSALGILWKEWCWSWNSSTLATSCEELTHWKKLWCWEGLGAGGEGDDRGWDGWMPSLTWWTRVWVNSGSWWWIGRPGVLWFMGLQRARHDWVTELNWAYVRENISGRQGIWLWIKKGLLSLIQCLTLLEIS